MKPRAALVPLALALLPAVAFAQANPRGEARLTLGGKAIVVEYGRPSLKGRDMMGRAEIGKAWRMGADDATTLKTETDLAFGAAKVPKGNYVLTATKLAEGQWQLNVNSPERTVVAAVPLNQIQLADSVEMLTIELPPAKAGGSFVLKWGTAVLQAEFASK